MSDRRTSLEKLSKYLRISKEDVLRITAAHSLDQSTNSKGFTGWESKEIKTFLENMSDETKQELQQARISYEQAKEEEQDLLLSSGKNSLINLNQAATILSVPPVKLAGFLRKHNISMYNVGDEIFWLKDDVLKVHTKPSRFQVLELRKLRETRKSKHHVNNTQLARMFDVPVPLVTELKKRLKLTGINPLTEAAVVDSMMRNDFSSKRLQVLNNADAEATKKSARSGTQNENSKYVSKFDLAGVLGLSHADVATAVRENLIPTDRQGRFVLEQVNCLDIDMVKLSVSRRSVAKNTDDSFDDEPVSAPVDIDVNVPVRNQNVLKEATLYMGPTNSGKTFNALNTLFEEYEANPEGKYVYAGPLRMLAFEVYEKMVARYGEKQVGFITGEEQINPEAPLLAATVEMAPNDGSSLVLDEAHWIFEPSRGSNWTELLLGGNYERMHILTAADARKVILALVADAEVVTERTFTRKTPITFKGGVDLRNVPARSAVVAFSRKAVFGIAELLTETTNLNVGVLYGALPLAARKYQVEKFIAGEYDIIVTTDVIGHGINLPVDNVVFAETNKFDGVERRDVHLWEAAQIAGRAGRYGLSDEGSVYWLNGLEKSDAINVDLVAMAAQAAQGARSTAMLADYAVLSPKYADLKLTASHELDLKLDAWHAEGLRVLPTQFLSPSNSKDVRERYRVFTNTLGLNGAEGQREAKLIKNVTTLQGRRVDFDSHTWKVTPDVLWQVVDGPFDVKLETLKVLARWLHEDKMTNEVERLFSLEVDGMESLYESMEELETAARLISELKMVNVMFSNETFVLDEELAAAEKAISDELIVILSGGAVEADETASEEELVAAN